MPLGVEPRDTPPTVFLVAHMGFAARYLLRTDIFSTLKSAGVRTVILTPNAGEQYMVDEFDHANVVLEPLRVDWNDFRLVQRLAALVALFYLRSYTIADGHRSEALRTSTASSNRSFAYAAAPSRPVSARAQRPLAVAVTSEPHAGPGAAALHAPPCTQTCSTGIGRASSSTRPGWFFPDAVVLREADARGITTSTVVLSWDNPTSKGYRGADPDLTIVWSDEMAGRWPSTTTIPAIGSSSRVSRISTTTSATEPCARARSSGSTRIAA